MGHFDVLISWMSSWEIIPKVQPHSGPFNEVFYQLSHDGCFICRTFTVVPLNPKISSEYIHQSEYIYIYQSEYIDQYISMIYIKIYHILFCLGKLIYINRKIFWKVCRTYQEYGDYFISGSRAILLPDLYGG